MLTLPIVFSSLVIIVAGNPRELQSGDLVDPGSYVAAQPGRPNFQKFAASIFGCPPVDLGSSLVVCTNKKVASVMKINIDCKKKVPLGTRATFYCPRGQEMTQRYNSIQCWFPGKWSLPAPACEEGAPNSESALTSRAPDDTGDSTSSSVPSPTPSTTAQFYPGYKLFPDVGWLKVVTELMTRNEAEKACVQDGAQLVTVNTQATIEAVSELVRTVPNSLHRREGAPNFWLQPIINRGSNSVRGYPWCDGEPNSPEPEICQLFYKMGACLLDDPCDVKNLFICIKS